MVHKIATSGHYHSSLMEIEKAWSLDDVDEALAVLAYIAAVEQRQLRAMKKGF
jgi:hypothetical protein